MVEYTGIDEVELAGLEERVRDLQDLFGKSGVSTLSTIMMVGAEIGAAEKRIGQLEADGGGLSGEKERREAEKYQNLVVGYLVQQEAHLSAAEQAQYGSFLEKPFFTRNDFEELDQFYGSAYDRLSERGKSELSFRVWEGIREGEYEFTDLPANVKEKEMERLFGMLSDPAQMPENLKQIPEKDRKLFQDAYQAGDHEKAAQLLNKESFKNNVSVSPQISTRVADEKSLEDKADLSKSDSVNPDMAKQGKAPVELTSNSEKSQVESLNI